MLLTLIRAALATPASDALAPYWKYQADEPLCAVMTEVGILEAYFQRPMPYEVVARWYVETGTYTYGQGVPFYRLGEAFRVQGLSAERRQLRGTSELRDFVKRGYAVMATMNPERYWFYSGDEVAARFSENLARKNTPWGEHVIWITDVAAGQVWFNDTALHNGAGLSLDQRDFDAAWSTAGRWAIVVQRVLPPLDPDGDGHPFQDADGDGYPSTASGGSDCNDRDTRSHPGAVEIAYDRIDQDCSGSDLDDFDGDGHPSIKVGGDDCDDNSRETISFEFGLDADGDGYAGDGPQRKRACSARAPWRPIAALDCNDRDARIHPGANDTPYDGVDQDCSGADLRDGDGDNVAAIAHRGEDCDDSNPNFQHFVGHADQDRDGFGARESTWSCRYAELTREGGDCDDSDPKVHPHAPDVPLDGTDSNCDGDDERDSVLTGHTFRSFDASDVHGVTATRWKCTCGKVFDSKSSASQHVTIKQRNAASEVLARCESTHGVRDKLWCKCGRRFWTDASFLRHLVGHAKRTQC